MPTITGPVVGIPVGFKDNLHADFRVGEVEKFLEQKGYRLGWARASVCSCAGANDQTEQPDPNCPLCKGLGWFYFRPDTGLNLDEVKAGTITALQRAYLESANACIISGIMTGLLEFANPRDKIGRWVEGTSMVTVRPDNKLGYWDRIIGIDSTIVFSQVAIVDGPTLVTRYPVLGINHMQGITQLYTSTDYTVENGVIKWNWGRQPAQGVRIALHYLTMPVWRIIQHPHAVRDTRVKRKTKTPITPVGNPVALAIQATVKYEFLAA